jgi:hypothetical protein
MMATGLPTIAAVAVSLDEYERIVGLWARHAQRLGAGLRNSNRLQRSNWHRLQTLCGAS